MGLVPFDSVFSDEKVRELKSGGHFIDLNSLSKYEESIRKNTSTSPSQKYWDGKRVFITGTAGMVGSTIADILIEMGADVYGAERRHTLAYRPNIQQQIEKGKLKLFEVDLRDYGRVASIMKEVDPHVIFHQAAESFVPTSMTQPSHVVENNCVTTVNMLEAATKESKSLEGIQLACSSEQYGFVQSIGELPVKETNELHPTSTYASTKVFTEFVGKSYYFTYKTPTVITRCFNQEGPRRGPQFFTARIAMQVRDIIAGKQDKLVMGNPNSVRDFTHIHDSARAQILAIEKCNRGEAYNVCSGKGIQTGDYAKLALRTFGLEGKVPLLVDESLLRSYERGEALFDGFIGDNSKFSQKTGWAPTKPVTEIIRDGVAFYSDQVKSAMPTQR